MSFDRSEGQNRLEKLEGLFLEFYFLKSKELGKLKKSLFQIQGKLKFDLSKSEQERRVRKIKIISEQIDRLENEIETLVPSEIKDEIETLVPAEIKFAANLRNPNVQDKIEVHIIKTYLDPLRKILFEYYYFLEDKLLTKLVKLKIITQEDNLRQNSNPDDIKEFISKHEEYSLGAKEKKWIDRHLDSLNSIYEFIEIVDDEDRYPSDALNEAQGFFAEKKKIISQVGEEGYSITKLWAKKTKVVEEIQQLLDNYKYNLYIPPNFHPPEIPSPSNKQYK